MSLEEVESELANALSLLRTGNHADADPLVQHATQGLYALRRAAGKTTDADELLGTPSERLSETEKREQLLFSRVATMAAEIADYKGDKARAKQALAPFHRMAEHLKSLRPDPTTHTFEYPSKNDLGWRLLRQELFCGWQLSVAAYRDNDVKETRRLLGTSLHIAEAMQPRTEGLLTQLYYAEAKLRLRERDFLGATEMYRKSLVNASARFSKAGDEDPTEKEAARYSIGKALGLGLAQCFLEQGRLEEAHTVVVAGRLLLEQTPDVIHQHYARHLLGSIERASARYNDTILFESAKAHLEACVAFFADKKPAVAFRSRYELGLVALLLGDLDAAEEAMRAVIGNSDSPTSSKWIAKARIGLSRIARRRGDHVQAADEAVKAGEIAQHNGLRAIEIRARTAHAQVLLEQHRGDPEGLEEAADDLRALLREIPDHDSLNRVFPLLVLARVHASRRDIRPAKRAYEAYEKISHVVQSARIRDYADLVQTEMFPPTNAFRCPADDEEPNFNLKANLKATRHYVLRKVMNRFPHVEDRAGALHVSPSTYHDYVKKLGEE